MPNKKQSARPAESGWLLEVGVIGISKTLKLLKLYKWTLLELEQVLRPRCRKGVNLSDKTKLPWLKIPPAPWDVKTRWFTDYDEQEERLSDVIKKHDKVQKSHGLSRGRDTFKDYRPSLEKWMIDANTLKLFRSGILENDTERKKLGRIKAHSLALSDALKEIAGKGRAKSTNYPNKLAEIIRLSKALLKRREEYLESELARAEGALREHDAKRDLLLLQVDIMRLRRKRGGQKWGGYFGF
jgi:hypothetical protein